MNYLLDPLLETPISKEHVEEYTMSLEDYLKPDAELAASFDAIDIISKEIDVLNDTVARIEQGGVKMNTAALAVATELALAACPTLLKHVNLDTTLSTESNGIGEWMLSTEILKEIGKRAKYAALDLLTKAINFVMDFYRKFRVGGKMAIGRIEKAEVDYDGKDIVIKKHIPTLQVGDEVITDDAINAVASNILSAVGSLMIGGDTLKAKVKLPGAKTALVNGEGGLFNIDVGKNRNTVKDFTLVDSDVREILKASKDAIKQMMDIDHRKVSKAILTHAKEERSKDNSDPSMQKYYAKALRTLTVKLPSMAVSRLAKVPSALGIK